MKITLWTQTALKQHTIPNAFSPQNQNHRSNQSNLPHEPMSSGSAASCIQGKRSQLENVSTFGR